MVTVFLIATAILNIGLGYWLAIYLRRAEMNVEAALPDEHAFETLADLGLSAPEPVAAAPQVVAPVAAPATVPTAPVATAPAAGEEQLEQDVLAGIEEFRNQLAQMKSRGDGAEQPATTAAVPAGPPA
jgi:hypothetical protein